MDPTTIIKEFVHEIKKFGVKKASQVSGVNYGTLVNWCNRGKTPNLLTAQKVAYAIGLEFLLFEQE